MVILFTLFYILLSFSLIYPPNEFVSAGLTIPLLFSTWLGSESTRFIQYHIKRSVLTLIIHSVLPLGYLIGLLLFAETDIDTVLTNVYWRFALLFTVTIPFVAFYRINIWAHKNWELHPICKNLQLFCNPNQSWMSVASDINIEYRRVDKISIDTNSVTKIVATDNWILKITSYGINCAHQSDCALIVDKSDTHYISPDNAREVQYINIVVKSVRDSVKPFSIRLNAFDFKDLQDKVTRPITVLPDVKFHKTLLDRFVDTFKEEVTKNVKFETTQELEPCIGCMQTIANVKLQKLCLDELSRAGGNASFCVNCYCRPMWCIECMAKWFASRQDESAPETWLASKCTCPMCRSIFCILDVSIIDTR